MKEPALKKHYREVVAKKFLERMMKKNVHMVPRLEKIIVNSALSADSDKTWVEEVVREIGLITGRKPIVILSQKSISNFKLRAGVPNGVKVTLRGDGMYEFLYRVIAVVLPMIRDFRGLRAKLDGRGNYTLGIQDHSIFPEINVDREKKSIGMDITFVTSALSDEEGRELLELMGMPFMKRAAAAVVK
jgi:large subunit ribosomal protein L5